MKVGASPTIKILTLNKTITETLLIRERNVKRLVFDYYAALLLGRVVMIIFKRKKRRSKVNLFDCRVKFMRRARPGSTKNAHTHNLICLLRTH